MLRRILLLACSAAAATGCLGSPAALPACDSWSAQDAICGLRNPEDLAALPGGDWIAVSEMARPAAFPGEEGGEGDVGALLPGRLTALRVSQESGGVERAELFPREWAEIAPDPERWGDPECDGPPAAEDFRPHGIDVGPGPEGRTALAVVTHGAREVIDLFEVRVDSGSERAPWLDWRGCVDMLPGLSANDVVLLDDAALLVTNMMPRYERLGPTALWIGLRMSLGLETGSVLRWSPGEGWRELENSGGTAPNGIAISPDGRSVFVAEWGGEAVYRLRFADAPRAGARPERDQVEIAGSPDNLTWTRDGRLLVAAQAASALDAVRCGQLAEGGCDVAYSVMAIEPEDLTATRVAAGRGAASVALEVGDELWIGFFSGDGITRVPMSE